VRGFLTVLAIICGFNISAEAIMVRFNFKVNSSGPSIYVCNAGIWADQDVQRACFIENSQTPCNPGDTSQSGHRCVCTSDNGGGFLMNYLSAQTRPWTEHGAAPGPVTNHTVRYEGQSNQRNRFSMIFQNETDSWSRRLEQLEFNLSSELYSASYFVDVCFRGPQIEFWQDKISTNWIVNAKAAASDFFGAPGGRNYSQLAGLQMTAYATCDLQGVGTYQTANVNGSYDSILNESNFRYGTITGLPTGGSDGVYVSGQVRDVGGQEQLLIDNRTLSNGINSPRFCKVRYMFNETNYKAGSRNLRTWQQHGARMTVLTEINEPPSSQD
jgi:hypothetical protein